MEMETSLPFRECWTKKPSGLEIDMEWFSWILTYKQDIKASPQKLFLFPISFSVEYSKEAVKGLYFYATFGDIIVALLVFKPVVIVAHCR